MSRVAFASAVLAAALVASPALSLAQAPASASPAPAAGAVTPADAAPFLGDWTITGESDFGAFTIALSVKAENNKVVGAISSDIQPLTPIPDVTKNGANLVLRYTFDFDGNSIPAVLTLAQGKEKLEAYFSFAEGAFEMSGFGTKAEAPK